MWRLYYLAHLMRDKRGIGVVEVILILVVNLIPYFGVGIVCIK